MYGWTECERQQHQSELKFYTYYNGVNGLFKIRLDLAKALLARLSGLMDLILVSLKFSLKGKL